MKTLFLVAALAAGTTIAATAEARESNRGPRMDLPSFEQLDINADGGVTLEEIQAAMQAHAAARFAETDTNGDGGLSADEMVAKADADRAERAANRAADRIEDGDTNGDGLLQADEIAAQMEERQGRRGPGMDRMFERVDADDNGTVSAEEYEQARAHMAERGERGRRGDN